MGYVECKWEKVNRTTFIRQLLSYSFDGVKASWILPLSIQCRGKRMGSILDEMTLREPWRFRWSIYKIGRKTCIWAKKISGYSLKKKPDQTLGNYWGRIQERDGEGRREVKAKKRRKRKGNKEWRGEGEGEWFVRARLSHPHLVHWYIPLLH